ncbi:hypothetical protein [Corynebacterium sp. HMSC073D01]|uniref:hypothetical protein n=1 Tax=Corynebacterium sp. HMSC073D01 TaxID=1739536 RepID=UPI0008A38642|nr:hypothetical protein [Corynebacterium sp. HMSC073D01]OFO47475.1 hypothetical protein HMPREF3044_01265 [Corynebacterium sp. HMSC073D01]
MILVVIALAAIAVLAVVLFALVSPSRSGETVQRHMIEYISDAPNHDIILRAVFPRARMVIFEDGAITVDKRSYPIETDLLNLTATGRKGEQDLHERMCFARVDGCWVIQN